MEITRCVMVIKETAITQNARAARFARSMDATARRLVRAHDEHNRTVDEVREALKGRGLKPDEMTLRTPARKRRRSLAAADLIVTVGGDGTALASSHYVTRGALLAVNSAPRDSIGHFCFARRSDFAEKLEGILSGQLRPVELARLAVSLDGRALPELALNDVLIAHNSPAATTRYIIKVGDVEEEHRDSGLWISTAAGSTAGIRSAGGRVMPLGSSRIQYKVRELYKEQGHDYRLVHGMVAEGERIIIASKMTEGRLYIDGSRTAYDFLFGMRASVRLADLRLRIFLARRTGD
jgi:NAD+ kinase